MSLLGPLSQAEFLAQHWQKKPLLVRQAIPGFTGLVSPDELARLAGRRDAVSRAVNVGPETNTRERGGRRRPRYALTQGPLRGLDLTRVRRERFTFLVQGLEHHVPAAWELLARFHFLSWARIDDLMVSWASPGGGVGPHVDDYDVFLLQGMGRRRWQIAAPGGVVLDDGEDLRIIKNFRATDDWVLEPGDMLYLPPGVPHHGVSVDECMTYSIGFLAPRHEQLAQNFLAYLSQQDFAAPAGIYSDPDLRAHDHAGLVDDHAVARVERVLRTLAWDTERVGEFLGRLLTGPKPTTSFAPPKHPPDVAAFAASLRREGRLTLAPQSRMLFRGERFFLNGDVVVVDGALRDALVRLADTRTTALPATLRAVDVELLHAWLLAGYVRLEAPAREERPREDRARGDRAREELPPEDRSLEQRPRGGRARNDPSSVTTARADGARRGPRGRGPGARR